MKRILLQLILFVCWLPLFAQDVVNGTNVLSSRIDTLIACNLPAGSHVGMYIYDLTRGKPLYAYQADKLSRPASTMKLVTGIAALSHPDADDPFRTEVWYKGTVQADTLHGDLYVVGGFDPEFDEKALDSLVRSVARLPFSVIQGRIYGDVSMKDSLYWGSGWLWDDNPASYQPYLSPLMLCKGVVTVAVSPAERGMAARVECTPRSSYYRVVNRTLSYTPSAGAYRLTRNWMENDNTLLLTGNVAGSSANGINLYASQDFFMHTFVERLQEQGVHCAEPLAAAFGNLPETAAAKAYGFREFSADSLSVRAALYETPLSKVLEQLMKESDNLNAEALLCRLGAQDTGNKRVPAQAGLAAVRRLLKELGHDAGDFKVADGCGLSQYDYLTPELLVDLLKYAYSRTDVFQKLYKALPVGGVDGTLKHRMARGTPAYRQVHAKTGSYTGINCLAGYLQTQDGRWVAFAIMNQNVLSGRKARQFQDAVCEAVITAQ